MGDFGELHVLRFALLLRQGGQVFAAQAGLDAVELAERGEVVAVVEVQLAGLEQVEGGDQVGVAADEAELAAELPLAAGLGHVTTPPSPLPVREAGV